MTAYDAQRESLHQALNEAIGVNDAHTLMSFLPDEPARRLARSDEVQQVGNELTQFRAEMDQFRKDVDNRFSVATATNESHIRRLETEMATQRGTIDELRGEMRGEFGELRGELIELRAEVRAEIGQLRGDMRGEFGEIRGEIGDVRAEIGDVRAEIGDVRTEIGQLRGEVSGEFGELRGDMRRLEGLLETRTSSALRVQLIGIAAVVATMLGAPWVQQNWPF